MSRRRPSVILGWRKFLPPDVVEEAARIAEGRNINPDSMFDGTPDQEVVEARWHLMHSMYRSGYTYPKIGQWLDVHHSTVINAVSKCSAVPDPSGPGIGIPVHRGIGRELSRYREGTGGNLLG